MRKSRVLLLAIFSFVTLSLSAADKNTNATTEIKNILQSSLHDVDINNEKVYVTFILSPDNELIILNTSNEKYDEIIRKKLTFEPLSSHDLMLGKKYTLPIVFKKM